MPKTITEMTRVQAIDFLSDKVSALVKHWNFADEYEIVNLCYEWNEAHEEADEIYMSEHYDEQGEFDGISIEDDWWKILS